MYQAYCGGKSRREYLEGECYGHVSQSFSHPNQYPEITKVVVEGTTATISYDLQKAGAVSLFDIGVAEGDIIRVVGMPGDRSPLNRQWFVKKVSF